MCCSRAPCPLAAHSDTAANHDSVAYLVRARLSEQLARPRELAHNPQPCHEPPPLCSPIRLHVRVLLECCSAVRSQRALARHLGVTVARATSVRDRPSS